MKAMLILPIALWLGYVVVANVMLGTKLVARLVSYNPVNASLEYGSAWSFWPGVVHVEDFRISGSDSVLQWVVALDEVDADIHLTDLFRRKFYAEDVRAEGFVFRVRLLVDPTSERDLGAPHVEALPPIPDFTNPPIKPELPPEHDLEHSDEGYNLWTAHLERVDTTLKEVWIQQYRYAGGGRVRGGFYFKPLRAVRVGPVALELRSGEVHLGEHVVARVAADADVTMTTFDPRDIEGLDIFESAFVRLRLDAQVPGLEFLGFPMGPRAETRFEDGSGELRANVVVDKGRVVPGSALSYETSRLSIGGASLRATTGGRASLRVEERGDARFEVRVPRAAIERPGEGLPPIAVEGVNAVVDAPELDLTRVPPRFASRLGFAAAAIPDLRWLNEDGAAPEAPKFTGGAAFLKGRAAVDGAGRGTGALHVLMKQGAMRWKETSVEGDMKATLALDADDVFTSAPRARIRKGQVELKEWAIEHRGEAWSRWWARVDIDDAKVGAGLMEAAIRVECKDARPAVGVLDAEDVVPGWATGLLSMEGLKASAKVRRRASDVDFTLLQAAGGDLAIRGRLKKTDGRDAEGAFLVKSGLLSVGIELGADGAGVHPLVGDDWVNEKMSALDR